MAARCAECGALFLPPRPMCARCYSTSMEWVECSGRGRLAGYSVVYTGLPAMVARGYDRAHPYVAGVVLLEEGLHINAQILGENQSHPDNVQVGMPLKPAFLRLDGENGSRRSLVFVTGGSPS